jgi:hypothetical protein
MPKMRRKAWRVASLVFLIPVGAQANPSTKDLLECITVDKVQMVTSPLGNLTDVEQAQWVATSGHQLQPGPHRALIIRQFSQDEGVADSQEFTKLTLYLNDGDLRGARPVVLNGNFSSGWSGFSYKADAWVAKNISIRLESNAESSKIEVTGTVNANNAFRGNTRSFQVHLKCEPRQLPLKELTPWQGGRGRLERAFSP